MYCQKLAEQDTANSGEGIPITAQSSSSLETEPRPFSRYTRFLVRWVLLVVLPLAGCTILPDTYPPPLQRPSYGPDLNPVGHFVSMNGPNADAHILRDVSPGLEAEAWRWTQKRPELQFYLEFTENLRLVMDFAIPDVTFPQRGPVTISFFVNGHLLDKVRYDKGGEMHFERPVPAAWLRTNTATVVAAEIDKVWIAAADGARLGFILSRAGFVE